MSDLTDRLDQIERECEFTENTSAEPLLRALRGVLAEHVPLGAWDGLLPPRCSCRGERVSRDRHGREIRGPLRITDCPTLRAIASALEVKL